MFITVVATIFMFQNIQDPLFELGASSWLIGIFAGGIENINRYVAALLILWGISLPILLIVFYILACKKMYIPFTVIATIDSVVVLLWTAHCFTVRNMYSFDAFIADAIISTLFSATLITFVCIENKRKDTAVKSTTTDCSLALELPDNVNRSAGLLQYQSDHI